MTRDRGKGQDMAKERLSDAYREAVGSVMAARTRYDQARMAHGAESLPARQAEDYLAQAIDLRNQLREQYDLVIGQ